MSERNEMQNGSAEAAAILVQTIFAGDAELRRDMHEAITPGANLLKENQPTAAMEFLRPWHAAALRLVRTA